LGVDRHGTHGEGKQRQQDNGDEVSEMGMARTVH
jgi:hypothetical protein